MAKATGISGGDRVIRPLRSLVMVASIAAALGAVQAIRNSRLLPTVQPDGSSRRAETHVASEERVSVLLPVRDEERNIESCLTALMAQTDVAEIIVLDDASSDGTANRAEALAASDPRVKIHRDPNSEVPPGWLGKSWACQRLAVEATGDVLVFVDADVTLAPTAVSSSVAMLRNLNLHMICPYPRQETTSALTRLVQPLLQWSWLTFIPGDLSMTRQLPSMAVGNGQFMVVDAASYRLVSGHACVAGVVLEDVALARAFREVGLRTAVVDGSKVARCRMYASDRELVNGYTKSLWSAFGGEPAAIATVSILKLVYVLPPWMLLASRDPRSRAWGAFGFGAAVVGRFVVARRTGQRAWPDSLAAPVSIGSLSVLTGLSIWRHHRGTITWKGRAL